MFLKIFLAVKTFIDYQKSNIYILVNRYLKFNNKFDIQWYFKISFHWRELCLYLQLWHILWEELLVIKWWKMYVLLVIHLLEIWDLFSWKSDSLSLLE